MGQTITNYKKDLFIGYTLKTVQWQKCSGSYLKFYGEKDFDQPHFNNQTDFELMFGHDFCGIINEQVHVIFMKDGTQHKMKDKVRTKEDLETHLFALKLYENQTFKVQIDQKVEKEAKLQDQFPWFMEKYVCCIPSSLFRSQIAFASSPTRSTMRKL
jgi:hypothetical protein